MKLYLITGFLGAGKTTFLQNFIREFCSQKIFIIVNEFGKTGIDGHLLSSLDAVLNEINNGSIFCSCRLDKFEQTLEDAINTKPEIILVEASGLSDPINIEKVLEDKPIDYCGSICIADCLRLESVVETALVCKNQITVSSLALLNKVDIANEIQIEHTKKIIKNINPYIKIQETSFGKFDSSWFSDVKPIGELVNTMDFSNKPDITLQKACIEITGYGYTVDKIRHLIKFLSIDTYRIKGFFTVDNTMYLANAVGPRIDIEEWKQAVPQEDVNKIVVLAGKGMQLRKALKEVKKWYGDIIKTIE